jgi:putative ABC transport system permease protein
VDRIDLSRLSQATIDPAEPDVVLIARSFNAEQLSQSLWMTEEFDGESPPDATPVWVSEAASDLYGLKLGDRFVLGITGKQLPVFVQGLWRDYEHQGGAVLIKREQYVQVSGDRAVNTVWFWLSPDARASTVRDAISERLPAGVQYDVREPRELRALSLDVFDRTFAITYVLELVAVAIGLFGIAAGISAQVVARRGEFGALRHLGFTRGQLAVMLGIEGSLLGTLGVIVGLVMGVLVSFILIYIVNRQSFHWSMDLSLPSSLLAGLSVALIASSALIAMFSGRQAMSTDAVRAVKEDW